MNLEELKQIIPIQWRVHSYSQNAPVASCICYIDARDVMNLLDDVVGQMNWQCDYKEIKGHLYAGIGIKVNDEWIWKWNCGTESKSDKAKGEASDALKRAAVLWGIGRFTYEIPVQYVKSNEINNPNNKKQYLFPIDDTGAKIKDLTTYLNGSTKVINVFSGLLEKQIARHEINIPVADDKTTFVDPITELITQINNCKDLNELRIIREANKELEETNKFYKKSLSKRYGELSEHLNKKQS